MDLNSEETDRAMMSVNNHSLLASTARVNESFITQFSTHQYFGNSAEEFYLHKTLSTRMKLLLSLTSLIRCHTSTFNAH
jgi:uncharacterized membrane protein YbaN (DUF454 family)